MVERKRKKRSKSTKKKQETQPFKRKKKIDPYKDIPNLQKADVQPGQAFRIECEEGYEVHVCLEVSGQKNIVRTLLLQSPLRKIEEFELDILNVDSTWELERPIEVLGDVEVSLAFSKDGIKVTSNIPEYTKS